MRYLIGTKNYGFFYKKYSNVIEAFSDANWNTLSSDSLSTIDYIFTFSSGVVGNLKGKQLLLIHY